MASTIQIKRGTGSAVPSGLADGELAINLDDGRFYFGSGSTSVNSFRFTNLIADNYIVSSSVTNITTQTLSGSTAFGDSSDDTHQFTGDVNVIGTVSASSRFEIPASSGNTYDIGGLSVLGTNSSTPTECRIGLDGGWQTISIGKSNAPTKNISLFVSSNLKQEEYDDGPEPTRSIFFFIY